MPENHFAGQLETLKIGKVILRYFIVYRRFFWKKLLSRSKRFDTVKAYFFFFHSVPTQQNFLTQHLQQKFSISKIKSQ